MSQEAQPVRLQGLPPLIGPDCRQLVLGSMPGALSLQKQQYYAHPRNHFWPLVYAVFGGKEEEQVNNPQATNSFSYRTLSESYDERLRFAWKYRIGLWDVLANCEREGSLDADIRKPEANDFVELLQRYTAIERIWFNGQAAARLFRKQVLPILQAQGMDGAIKFGILPSSSPARTLSFETKLKAWQELGS